MEWNKDENIARDLNEQWNNKQIVVEIKGVSNMAMKFKLKETHALNVYQVSDAWIEQQQLLPFAEEFFKDKQTVDGRHLAGKKPNAQFEFSIATRKRFAWRLHAGNYVVVPLTVMIPGTIHELILSCSAQNVDI